MGANAGYKIGRFMGRHWFWLLLLLAAAFFWLVYQFIEQDRLAGEQLKIKESAAQLAARAKAENEARARAEFEARCSDAAVAGLYLQAQALMKRGAYADARNLLAPCSKKMASNSKELALMADADARLLAAHRAEIQKRHAAELAQRKKEGVSIGMTQDRVLQSSWGKPRKINRTTTLTREREQWVYDGGYLYFDNGILTAIQN